MSNCRWCRALILWADTPANSRRPHGGRMPVDIDRVPVVDDPAPRRFVKLIWRELYPDPLAITLSARAIELERAQHAAAVEQGLDDDPQFRLWTNHMRTCPHRQRREGRKAA